MVAQEIAGRRVPVEAAYQVGGTGGEMAYGFRVGPYARQADLMIDPLLQSTYLGGTVTDVANAIAIHPTTGDVYVAGQTSSADFPGVAGGAQAAKSTGDDAFVARLTPSLLLTDPIAASSVWDRSDGCFLSSARRRAGGP